jgi:hypothetical protein
LAIMFDLSLQLSRKQRRRRRRKKAWVEIEPHR